MDPIEMLKKEHRVIERVLDALQSWTHQVVEQDVDGRAELARFTKFFREFADACHHGKEERILFATMVEHGFSIDNGPIKVMLSEHEQGRALVGTLAKLADSASPWSGAQRQKLMETVQSYSAMLREHINKEDTVLYPMATTKLPGMMAALGRQFERFEAEETGEGEHERLHQLADELIERHAPGDGAAHAHG